jgi:hypothetical protein
MKIKNNYLLTLLLAVIIVKLSLLFWSAHPFDFWSFVTTLQRNTLYNLNVFEGWNKSNLLIAIWYPLYSFYLIMLNIFSIPADNILFVHFIFKIPFLFIDLLSGFLIYKIINILKNNNKLATIGFFFWFLNPIVFLSYGIHGNYEILVPFAFILILYGLLIESALITSLGFLIGIGTKYFFIIFLPFITLYLLSQKKYRFLLKSSIILFLGLIISYIQFFFDSFLFFQTINSIIHHSGANIIKLSPITLFSAINYIFSSQTPINNLNHPLLFTYASYGLFFVGLFLIIHFIYRLFYIFYFKNNYTFKKLIFDLFVSSCYFLIFLTNFQAHYLVWLVPFFIIYLFKDLDLRFFYIFIAYTVVGFIYAFRGELGTATFFLDIINWGSVKFISLTDKSIQTVYREGSLIIGLLITTLVALIIPLRNIKKILYNFERNLKFYFLFVAVLWCLILIPYFQVINLYFNQSTHFTDLAYKRMGQLNSGIIYTEYGVSNIIDGKIYFNSINGYNLPVIQKISKFSSDDLKNFEAFLLISTSTNNSIYQQNLENKYFNDCLISKSKFRENILNRNNYLSYSGFEIPISCIKKENNYININQSNTNLNIMSIKLYITNKKVDFLFSNSLHVIIYFMAMLGLVYLLTFIILGYFIVRKFWKK